jgi:hypothetical protein
MILNIELGNKIILKFQILDTPVAHLWVNRMLLRDQYPIDHPDRFYGFNSPEEERNNALLMINNCINTINNHDPIVSRSLTTVTDQDTLNYLHSIFERYHGLLDQQSEEYWNRAPRIVRRALTDLNLAVHRCESVSRSNRPRFVCTWFGLPKTHTLTDDLMKDYGTSDTTFGTVYLNYCEIGKNLEALTQDDDNYISNEAFKPFNYYSADFVVKFFDDTPAAIKERLDRMEKYYTAHQKYFESFGYTIFDHVRLLPLRFPVAKLIEDMDREELLSQIQQHQQVTNITIE